MSAWEIRMNGANGFFRLAAPMCLSGACVHMKAYVVRLLAALLIAGSMIGYASAEVRIGITQAMFVKDSLTYDRWAKYLSRSMGQPVLFVYRKSYGEIQELLRQGDLHFAWTCGYPFIKGVQDGFLRYVATPEIGAEPLYRIYLIVPASSTARSLDDLKGGIFAFSDPDSASFRAFAAGQLSQGKPIMSLNQWFPIRFFTYSHAETVKAVADRVADGGSVDGHVWEAMAAILPELTRKTRVIARSGTYGLPPFVASWRADERQIAILQKALLDMNGDREGKSILELLQVTRFARHGDKLYDSIRVDLGSTPMWREAPP